MYLHLGQSVVVRYKDIIGIFDLDNASWSHRTRSFLEKAEQEGRVVSATGDLPNSFTVCRERDGKTMVYLSQFSSATLNSRMENGWVE